jgi:hypothetical protein
MSRQRIAILSSQTLFAEGLRYLIEAKGHSVISVQPWTENTLAHIKALHPETVILSEDTAVSPTAVSALLDFPSIRIVQLTLDNNTIHINGSRQLVVRSVDDLIHALDPE